MNIHDLFHPNEPWIQTYLGIRYNPTNPIKETIQIEDIAHSLSNQCRFSGHCNKFYSVAQHSVLVSLHCDKKDALWGLLHDASEAYLVDIPAPLKRSGKFDIYKEYEKLNMKAICERFNLSIEEPESIAKADKVLLATEARDLLLNLRKDWVCVEPPLSEKIEPWAPEIAKQKFLSRFYELFEQKNALF